MLVITGIISMKLIFKACKTGIGVHTSMSERKVYDNFIKM